ncbi:abnormal spindle-like microcephaly-associated protein [Aulostomus maculatus]
MATASAQRGFLDFSPVRKEDANKENDVPILSLTLFSKAPFVTFGTVKLGTSKSAVLRIENPTVDAEAAVTIDKIPSSKGFSLDHNAFTVQPQGSFNLKITWTPAEDGGIRELIVLNANGVLKLQAVLLGRAEAPKKKKKSLWDTIKNKRGGENMAVPRGKKMEAPWKMAANKTIQVSREPQYKRDKPRSPLTSLNEGRAVRERSISKHSPTDYRPRKSEEHKALNLIQEFSEQENLQNAQRNSPLVLLVPASRVADMSESPDVGLGRTLENKELTKMLNRTLSPIGTPERFRKLMPNIQTVESPLPAPMKSGADAGGMLHRATVPSLKDALALIDSDLSQVNGSLCDTSSTCYFSDSLDCKSGRQSCGSDKNALPDSPELSESNEPRLTFFVSKEVPVSEVVECDNAVEGSKKASFNSDTVIKSKAPVTENCPSGRKIKKSRRRLLENTLELSDGNSWCESGPGTPRLPVIGLDVRTRGQQSLGETGSLCVNRQSQEFSSSSPTPRIDGSPTPVTFPVTSPLPMAPSRFIFSVTSPPPGVTGPVTFTSPSLSPLGQSSPIPCNLTSNVHEQSPTAALPEPISATPAVQEDLFPVHLALKTKKRKSEEYLKSNGRIEDNGKAEQVKRTKVAARKPEPTRSSPERRRTAQRQPPRTTGSVRSVSSSSSLKAKKSAAPAKVKQPISKLASRGATSLKSSGPSSLKTVKVVAVAQSKLTFIKPAQTAIPRHPMPFAAKNMFYDERWIEKQERGFTWWINYVLTPDDFKVVTEVTKVSAVSLAMGCNDKFSVPKAPTKEEMSFSTYTARRKLNRLRRSACQLFTSEGMVKAIRRLELEVEAKRLLIRKDRHLWKDIGERQKVLNWLLSYNPLWLRIGLETIYGELISLESNSDALGLAMFILQRLLWNPDIAAEFRHPKVPHLYKDGHEEALSRFTLKKLLLLVCFLDKAKESRLIEHDPCLFCMDAEFKTSKDLLLAFSRDFLSGEGILPRHLGYLGLPVSHVQKPLDEFNFAVKNLAVDLKCGIRLVRVMELLAQQWDLSAKLRLPAISRLQKVHNVDITFQVLKSKGVNLRDEHGSIIESRDIVDGHREKTLSLLWKLIFAFQVEVILDEDQLREEIGYLRRTSRTKRKLASLKASWVLQPSPVKSRVPYKHSSMKITLLMDWVCAVCDFYNIKVENFTVSFSDGRVLCYLIHHYHPGLLPEESVSHSTTQTVECSLRGRLELNCSASDSDNSFDSLPAGLNGTYSPSVEFKELLENEKNNFRLVNSAVAFLGGVPAMINPADMSNTIPNEKVVMSYLSFLCTRLLDLRNETRAARVIQGAWRKYKLKKDLELYKECNAAAVKIQLVVRSFLEKRRAKRQTQASIIIQSVWRGYVARKRLRLEKEAQLQVLQHEAATVIQAQWRMFTAMRVYQRLRYYTIVVQAQWRMRRAVVAFARICWATAVIQKYSRLWNFARKERECYLSLKTAVVKIQRGYRRWKTKKMERENFAAKVIQATFKKWYREKMARGTAAAVRIQSWYRMQRHRHKYERTKRSIVLIQAQYRGCAQRQCFQKLRLLHNSAIVIQSAFRGHKVRKQVMKMKLASVIIQQWFRGSVKRDMERQRFERMRCAARTIQAAYHRKVARDLLKEQHKRATVIQTAFRKYAAQRRYLIMRRATAVIQQKYRATILAQKTKKDYDGLRKAVLIIQAHWRGRADRKRIEKYHQCATLIRAHYCRHKAQAEYRSKKAAAVVIQRHYRAYVAGKDTRQAYLQKRAACITLQAGFKGMQVRADLRKKHKAATIIQSSVRMLLSRKQYILLQSAVIIIQTRFKALLLCRAQQHNYRELKRAALIIQTVYRGYRVRDNLKKRSNAARAIQAQFRMYKVRMAYLATKCAAIILQERYRAKMLRDQQMQRYRTMKSAAVVIQAAYRGHRARMEIAEMHRAAAVIQKSFRTMQDRNKFLAIKAAAVVCQKWYRAVTLTRKVRQDYLLKHRAAICLQSAYRGYGVRKQLRIKHKAAVTIQSQFRMYQQKTFYKRLHWAVSVVQARHRANKKMRQEKQTLSAKRNAAVVLQAAFRGMKSRRIIKQKHQAASFIQRAYRAHCEHKQFLTCKSAVLTIQQRYRATVGSKEQRKKYLQIRSAAIILQAAFRAQQVRRGVACWHQAATVIQSAFRRHREEVKFQAMRLSAVFIQRYYRAYVLQKQQRAAFLRFKRSAIILQAAFRGHCVRGNIAKMQWAATVIQVNFKRHKQQLAFRKQRWAACVLQQRFRAQRQRNAEVQNYQECRKAVIRLQAAYRGMKSRQKVRQNHCAATIIQRAYTSHRERKRFLALKSSVLAIQRKYRATVAEKEDRKRYLQMQRAAVIFQAAYRGRQVRKDVVRWHQAATRIQSAFRRHRERVKFQAMRLSAIIIQRSYRACILQRQEREKFLKVKYSTVILQAAFRGHCVRSNIAKMQWAATVIQVNFKRHKQQLAFRKQRWAACVLQQRFRAQRQRNAEVQNYQECRKAVIRLQAAYRGMKSRQKVRQNHCAATIIQRAYTSHRERKRFLALKSSVLAMQRQYRANATAKEQMQKYQKMCCAAVILQAAFRAQQVRRGVACWHQAATVIQSAFRRHREEVKFQAMRLSAVFIQRYYRAYVLQKQQRAAFLRFKRSAIILQAAFRGHCVRGNIAKMQWAATVIQVNFKRHKQQLAFRKQRWAACVLQQRFRAQRQRNAEVQNYQVRRKAVIRLQAAYRGMKTRRSIRQRHQAASVIQRVFRAHYECKQYLTLKSSVVTVQRKFRAAVAAKAQRRQYVEMRSAAIIIQATFRGHQARQQIAGWHQAATVIQSAFRMHADGLKFQAMRLSAITIQRYHRACVLQRQERHWFKKIRQSTIILQAAFRGHCVRRDIHRQSQAATLIQSHWRCLVQRRSFHKKREAVVKLQQKVRAAHLCRKERNNYTQIRQATITLQSHCRTWIAKQQAREAAKAERRRRFTGAAFHHLSAIKIQRALRAHWALESAKRQIHSVVTIQCWVRLRQQRRRYLEDRRKVVTAQRAVKRWLTRRHKAASVIQQAVRRFILLRRQKRVQRGIAKAQALWRGHCSRRLNDNPKMVKLRQNLRQVSAGAREEDKLCNKTSSALDYLLRYKQFSYILEALKNLETATRLSPVCCEQLVESGATSVIFTLVRCCNRSVPCMDVITFSIQILLNLSKYHKTIEAVYLVENSVETLVDLLQRYREKAGDKVAEKGGSIFTKACFLLALLLQDKHRAVEVMRLPKILERIRSIYRLTARKHKLDAERTVTKQKMNASINGSFYVQATPRKSRPLPKFAPDWVLRKDKLKDVVDPLRAIQMVAETLTIVL